MFFHRRHQSATIVGRNRDCIKALCNQAFDHFDLAFGGGAGWTGLDDP